MRPSVIPVLFAQQEPLHLTTTNPVDDNLLQTMEVIAPGAGSDSVELQRLVSTGSAK